MKLWAAHGAAAHAVSWTVVPDSPAPAPCVPAAVDPDIAVETTTSCSDVTVAMEENPPGVPPPVTFEDWGVPRVVTVVAASAYPPIMAIIAAIVTR